MGKKRRSVGSKSEECKSFSCKNVNPSDTTPRPGEAQEEQDDNGGGGHFFACYLLTSLSPRYKGHTYIGFTVNPKRRIKQHNGELTSGAFRTKSKRPWEMALCIYGFPTNIAALQFEWAWQHPTESLAVREAASKFKSFSGIANKVKLALTMLTLPSWQSLDLTVNFFSTKYQRHCAGCPCLPEQMNIQMCSMDELPCYTGDEQNMYRLVESDIEKSDGLTKHKKVKYVGLGYNEMKETLDCSIAPNSVDSRNRTEKMTPASALNIGGSGLVQPRSSVLEYNHQQPSCTNKPLEEVVSCSRVAETFQGNIFPQRKSCNNELVSPAGRDMPNMKVCSKDEVLIKDPVVLSNVEVVDLSTPESGCRTSLQTKKRRTDDSKFIDLTKSPIFV
ncbi:Structure-specific endonuclease subunit SLX1-like [Heracleum sosnowskyi]|uniref:Structure-specific endonuclease subunit SLX1 homolog n=1 Tax=Heracleum sosnowskyi TaxID=360622 RepID=A0AAD8GR97_9APIA|nr:Structure-specific endonuclease subunit SLX1-like [Heracleum sosnowskyi]